MLVGNVGILGIGVYLPEQVRKNDWWPADVVDQWRKRTPELMPENGAEARNRTPGQLLALQGLALSSGDPFHGAVERRIAPEAMMASEMEYCAAKEALDRAGLGPDRIDFILSYSVVPDYLNTPNACALHRRLGLRSDCLATAIDGACNSFHLQLSFAQSMISTGNFQYGLLVQSNQLSRLIPRTAPASAWFGDAATAVVVGPVETARGNLASSQRTDGTTHDALVSSVPGRRWYEEGRVFWHPRDRSLAKETIVNVVDQAKEVVQDALRQANVEPSEVDFYACHQPTTWLGRVSRDFAGLVNARSADTFAWAGSLSAANVPLCLSVGERENLLRPGDMVATFAGGSGLTWSSFVFEWGSD